MANYGRNFEFRISPPPEQRLGRYKNGDTPVPIGAPVAVAPGSDPDINGRLEFELADGTTEGTPGMAGIAIYEHLVYDGFDPVIRTESQFGDVPAGQPAQLVYGKVNKVVLRNTEAADLTFLGNSQGSPRAMVDPAALATLAVGDGLIPGAGTDDDGYWAVATTEDPWLIVTQVDLARGEVEAQMQF